MKHKKEILLLLGAIFLLTQMTGCLGLAYRGMSTDATSYSVASAQKGSIPKRQSRVTVYSVGGGPNLSNTLGRIVVFSLDGHLYRVTGNSYYILDIPTGTHEITANGIADTSYFKKTILQKGEDVQYLSTEEGKEYFLRVDIKNPGMFDQYSKSDDNIAINVVSRESALQEMSELKLYSEPDTGLDIE